MNNETNWAKLDLEYIWHPCSQMKDYEELAPIVIEKGEGLYLYDQNNKKYADVISSWWCNLLGHRNPKINRAIKTQLDKLEHVIFANFTHKQAIKLCDRLSKILPQGLCKFNFTDNGSSAIEASMKVSFQYHQQTNNTQKTKFLALSQGYHGETITALSAGDCDLYTQLYKPILMDIEKIQAPDCYRCPYNKNRENCNCECFIEVEKTFQRTGNQTCAILVEPLLQGAGGMKIYPPLYLKKLRKICDKFNVHLIADEIATGFGRTGKMFACDHAEISPDIICLSKGITGGYMPMAMFVTTQKIYDAFYDDYNSNKAFLHSHTYSGNPLACAAANAVLDLMEDGNILKQANENAKYFNKIINDKFASHKNIGEIRSLGLINALEIVENKTTKSSFDNKLRTGYQIYQTALKKGLILRPLGDIIYFNPPLNITQKEMKEVVDTAYECLIEILPE
ncbi:MAG: adenosylmethionine--8-amino-7-oxononanoate transaminase [Candidatus Gastranaerophilales bacterium]